ncbi:MAG: YbjN domain-containing protein [Ruminococcus sp.]
MADETMQAREIYEKFCSMLDSNDWHYTRHDDDLIITCGARGEDLPMDLLIRVNDLAKVVVVYSSMPYRVAEDKRVDLAMAVCVANYGMIQGSFSYDITDGEIRYKLVQSYRDNEISESYLEYMLMLSVHIIDEYNDKFLMIDKGILPLQKFIESEYSN